MQSTLKNEINLTNKKTCLKLKLPVIIQITNTILDVFVTFYLTVSLNFFMYMLHPETLVCHSIFILASFLICII